MNENRLKLFKGIFYFLIIIDLFGDALTGFLPAVGFINLFGSTVTNTGEALLFMVVLDNYYGGEIMTLMKWVTATVVGIIGIIFLFGGLVL